MTDGLTITECEDRLRLLKTQFDQKQGEIQGFTADLENLAVSSPNPADSEEIRLEFSENKAKKMQRLNAAKNLASRELNQIQNQRESVFRTKVRLESADKLAKAKASFNVAMRSLEIAWEEMQGAVKDCPAIAEMNFPRTATLDTTLKNRGMFAIEDVEGVYKITSPSQS